MSPAADGRPVVTAGLAAGSDELEMLASSARGVFQRPSWSAIAEAGFLGLLTPEDSGGLGFRPHEACVVAAEAGRSLLAISWAETALAAAALADDPRQSDLVDRLLSGTASASVAGILSAPDGASGSAVVEVEASGDSGLDALVLVSSTGTPVLVVDTTSADVTVTAVDNPIDTSRGRVRVAFEAASASPVSCADPHGLVDASVLLGCADSFGALTANSEALVEYLSQREAFGQPIASFQAIQHRLAEHTTLVGAACALIRRAATALAEGAPASDRLVAATHGYLERRATAALDDLIQLSGGIGFTWEWPVHHAMRRALVNATSTRPGRDSLEVLLDTPPPDVGDYPEQAAFRQHVRAVIGSHSPYVAREGHRTPTSETQEAALREWYRVMYDEGLLGASWPEAWGGRADHHPLHALIVSEELLRARAPGPIDQVKLASHALLHFGTDEQKARDLPPIRRGEHIWCQLFSEPDAGSDLAGIRARAEPQPDGTWLLSGQKTWTTDGHWAQLGLALLRTGGGVSRHAGMTAFIVPMDAPQLKVQAMRTIGGAHEFNDVFLDDVVLGADAVLGEVGGGWTLAMSGLETERFGVAGNVVLLDLLLDDLRTVATALRVGDVSGLERQEIRFEYASLAAEAQAAKAFVADHVDRALLGLGDDGDAPIAKILYTETYNRIARFGVQLVQELRPVPDAAAAAAQRLEDAWLWSRSLTISGGSAEVMRNILAKRRLHLPQR